MKEHITLTIRKENLLKIVSGEKTREYRAAKDYYFKLFEDLYTEGPNKGLIKNPCKRITFRCANQKMSLYAIVQVKEIAFEQFVYNIPEDFKKNDIAFTIYIEKVIEHNINFS